jgi:hypothetical protein
MSTTSRRSRRDRVADSRCQACSLPFLRRFGSTALRRHHSQADPAIPRPSKTKGWWPEVSRIDPENFSSRIELIYAERRAIVHEKPLYNITYNNQLEADAESCSGARYTLEQATRVIVGDDSGLADPQLWMMRQLRKGRFHGFKIGRNWFMTQADVEAAIDSLRNGTKAASNPVTDPVADPRIIDGLSERAKRRLRSV